MRLEGKIAIVTGAGSGLGMAAAHRMAAEGAKVACVDRDISAAESAAQQISEVGEAMALAADVSVRADCESMVQKTESSFGPVDVLMANAGISGPGNALEVDEELWDQVIDIDLKGVWLSCRAVLSGMVERRRGSIVTTASVGGLVGVGRIMPYAAAKGGVIAMTRQMAVDFGEYGIRVNALAPGTIHTPLVEDTYRRRAAAAADPEAAYDQAIAAMTAKYPLGRFGDTNDVGAAATFLASDEAQWITGVTLPVDGGYTAA